MNLQTELPSGDLFYESLVKPIVDDARFVGRSWLAEQVKDALDQAQRRFVLLTAEPGAGKTAFMAWLTSESIDWLPRCLILRYFIRRDSQTPLSSGDARSFLFTIGHQLAALQPDLFPANKIEVVVDQDVGTLGERGRVIGVDAGTVLASPFHKTAISVQQKANLVAGELVGLSVKQMVTEPRLLKLANLHHLALVDPAQRLARNDPGAQIVILVDGLDELRYFSGEEGILYWLTTCPELPDNVRLVLTSRPDDELLREFRGRQQPWLVELSIEASSDKVQADVRRYAERIAAQDPVQGALSQQRMDPHKFVDTVVNQADGNFQYLAALFRSLQNVLGRGSEEQIHSALELDDVPASLEALYAFFMRQVRSNVARQQIELRGQNSLSWVSEPAWEHLYQPLLGVLSVVREPLDHRGLLALSRVQAELRWFSGALDRFSQFLDREDARFRFYHATLPEFLTAEATRRRHPDCFLSPREWHRKIVAYYMSAYALDWSACDDYGLTHLIQHVIPAELPDPEREMVLDKVLSDDFENACMERFGWLYSYVESLEALTEIDPQRVATACLDIILERLPNSLVMQRVLRLLVKIHPETGQIGNPRSSRHQDIDRAVRILSRERQDEIQKVPLIERIDAAADLTQLLDRVENPRVKGVLALALGETGGRKAAAELMEMLKTTTRQTSWAAADALLALDDRSIIPELIQWYEHTKSRADKERVLYILGWMHADEARVLKPRALTSTRAKNLGRAIDLTWLLPPEVEDVDYLLGKIDLICESDAERPEMLGVWKNEWLQKRLVRALHKLGVIQALPALKELKTHVSERGKSKKEIERNKLEISIREAIRALGTG